MNMVKKFFKNLYNIVNDYATIKRLEKNRLKKGFDGIPVITLPVEWCDSRSSDFEKYKEIREWVVETASKLAKGEDSGIVIPRILDKHGKLAINIEIVMPDKDGEEQWKTKYI